MRNVVLFVLFSILGPLTPAAHADQTAPGNYAAVGVSVQSGNVAPTVSAGVAFAPLAGFVADYSAFGTHAGHGGDLLMVGYMPVSDGVHLFAGGGVAYVSDTGANVAYAGGGTVERNGLMFRAAYMRASSGNSTISLTIGKRF